MLSISLGDRRKRRVSPLYLLAALVCACADAHSRTAEAPHSHVINDHKIRVGDTLSAVTVDCNGTRRIVGRPGSVQLVTFSTKGDCTACLPHLAGLEQVLERRALAIETFHVTYASNAELASVREAYRAITHRAVCVDEHATLWDKYNISHTPVTVLLRSGEVVYMHDMPLVSDAAQKTFEADLRALGAL